MMYYFIEEIPSAVEDLKILGDDQLNFHKETIFLFRKEGGHYDLLYENKKENGFGINNYLHED